MTRLRLCYILRNSLNHVVFRTSSTMAGEGRVAVKEMHAFVVRCMEKAGAKTQHSNALADLLVAADYRGHYSHGLNRLGE